jgi:hypothetical protein
LLVALDDGRTLTIPFSILPGLDAASGAMRREVEIVGDGVGVRFPLCDEDFSVESLLAPERMVVRRRAATE